jgi:hypothetical protein
LTGSKEPNVWALTPKIFVHNIIYFTFLEKFPSFVHIEIQRIERDDRGDHEPAMVVPPCQSSWRVAGDDEVRPHRKRCSTRNIAIEAEYKMSNQTCLFIHDLPLKNHVISCFLETPKHNCKLLRLYAFC